MAQAEYLPTRACWRYGPEEELLEAEIQVHLSGGKRQVASVGTSMQFPVEGPCWVMWATCCLSVLALHIPFQKSKGCDHSVSPADEWLAAGRGDMAHLHACSSLAGCFRSV